MIAYKHIHVLCLFDADIWNMPSTCFWVQINTKDIKNFSLKWNRFNYEQIQMKKCVLL